VDAWLCGSILRILEWTVAAQDRLGLTREREGNRMAMSAPLDNYPTADGSYVCIVAGSNANFRRLCILAGVRRSDTSSRQPRLHDLRHTFAVHRLTEWYKTGANVQLLLPALSTYLGHIDLRSTQCYLTMTPELLAEANHRFQDYVDGVRHE